MTSIPFKPKVAGFELTLACNMRCIHCGSSAGKPAKDELSREEGLSLCEQLAALGNQVVTLSGGEPLVSPHWHAYAKKFGELGLKVYMITNGYLLEENMDKIIDSPIKRLGISLDGTEATHNYIRQVGDSFQKAVNGAKLLMEKGISIGIVTHISKLNIMELEAMYETFTGLGFSFWQIQMAFPQGRMKEHLELVSEPEDMLTVARFMEDKRKENKIRIVPGDNLGYYSSYDIGASDWHGCFGGRWLIGICANGDIKPCLSLPPEFVEGNIRQRSLKEIWEDPENFKFNRFLSKDKLGGRCKDCDKGELCWAGCKVTAYAMTGDLFNNPYCLYRLEKEKAES
ncbi:MAG: radical SAM protein [Chloroflexi bacterium]|nr:radical SAM protein [Chloroflexota bacterium]